MVTLTETTDGRVLVKEHDPGVILKFSGPDASRFTQVEIPAQGEVVNFELTIDWLRKEGALPLPHPFNVVWKWTEFYLATKPFHGEMTAFDDYLDGAADTVASEVLVELSLPFETLGVHLFEDFNHKITDAMHAEIHNSIREIVEAAALLDLDKRIKQKEAGAATA